LNTPHAPSGGTPSEPAAQLLGLIELARRARDAASPQALAFVMVNESLQVLRYRQAALWRVDASVPGFSCVAAVSGLPEPNPNAPYIHWLARVFREAIGRPGSGAVAALSPADLPDLAAEWSEWLPAHVLWVPLAHGDARPAGYLLFAADTAWTVRDLTLAAELGASYAHALAALVPRSTAVHRLGRSLRQGRRRWLWLLPVLVACLPVQTRVLAPAEVVPKDPFLVRAPQDGVVDRVLVRPNQAVTAGTPLFNLDQAALQARQAIASKAYDTAQEEFRQSAQIAVTDDKGKLEMSLRRGALQEKKVELGYLNELMGRVQVRAERDGVAVISDVNEWQGRTVQLGERVLTLADPRKVELSIWLPVGERFAAEPGTVVSLYPNASPLSSYDAVVTEVAYSAEPTRDGQIAYRLKADFAPGETPPRIGLMGTARLHGDRAPLLYHALRRPLTAVRQWLGL
jgi:hypothetical protein